MGLRARLVVGATALAVSTGLYISDVGRDLVGRHEGTKNAAYVDPVGIVTICTGHTKTARPGMVLSDEQCLALLRADLAEAVSVLEWEAAGLTLTQGEVDAYVSFIFNVGASNFRRSTLLKLVRAGKRREACDQLLLWVYADGQKLRGLEKRRAEERKLCLRDLAS